MSFTPFTLPEPVALALTAVMNQAFDAVVLIDEQQNIIYFSEGAQNLFGYAATEVLHQPVGLLIPSPFTHHHQQHVHAFANSDDPRPLRSLHVRLVHGLHKSGAMLNLDITIAKARLPERPWVFAAFIRDVTERVHLETTLRQNQAALENQVAETENRYRTLFEQSPDAILVHQHGEVLFANAAALRLLGAIHPNQVVGQPVFQLVAPEYLDVVRTRVQHALLTHADLPPLEEELVRLDGTRVHVEVAGSVIAYNGQPAIQLVGRDISDRKQRERELRALADLSVALRQATTQAELAQVVIAQVGPLLSADGARLSVVDSTTAAITFSHSNGVLLPQLASNHTCQACLVLQLVLNGQTLHVNDWRQAQPTSQCACLHMVQAVLAVPLIAQEKQVGLLLAARVQARPFSQADHHLLTTLADMAASALHRAGLHELTERRLRRLAAMHAIDAAINASFDLRTTLHTLLEHVIHELGVDAACVLFNRDNPAVLKFAAGMGFRTRIIESTTLRLGEGVAGRAALERTLHQATAAPSWRNRQSLRSAEGFVAHFAIPLLARRHVIGVLEVFKRGLLQPDAEWHDHFAALAGQAALALEKAQLVDSLQHSHRQLEKAYDATIEGWSLALELRDQETQGHTLRVTELTEQLALALNLPEEERTHLRRGALLHDIGKMAIPDAVLLKPGPLTPDETRLMRRHPVYARQMLAAIEYLQPALTIPYYHHERWDGSGYPEGLRGTAIPLAARLFAVVDVWDALRSDRPYRQGWTVAQVRAYLKENAGVLFDPDVVQAFLQLPATQEPAA